MLLRRKNSENGHTVLEISIAIGIMGLLLLFMAVYFNGAQVSVTLGKNNELRTAVVKQIHEVLTSAMGAPGILVFDPQTTLHNESGSLQFAGFWRTTVPNGTPPYQDTTTAQPFNFGGGVQLSQDSHLLVSYKLETSATTGLLDKVLKYAVISRCTNSMQETELTSIAEVLPLKRPMWINNQIHCCASADHCPDSDSLDPKLWPTVYIYKPGFPLKSLPTKIERTVVPGVGFMVYFNRHTDPDAVHFTAFMLENKCKTTDVGYDRRAPLKCSKLELGKGPDANFVKDVFPVSVMQESRPLTTDMTGSGFIKL